MSSCTSIPGLPRGPYCGFWSFAARLSHDGIRSLLFNLRCFGDSDCPGGAAHADPVADVQGAVAELRRLGARAVVLVGASLGGNLSILTAPPIRPVPAAVVDLSGESDLGKLLGGKVRLNALAAAPRVRSPALVAVARGDRYAPLDSVRELCERLGGPNGRLIVEPATFGHGWAMLVGLNGPSSLAREVGRFIRKSGVRALRKGTEPAG